LNEIVNLLECLSKKDVISAIQLVNSLADNGLNLKNFVVDMVELLRKMMLGKINPALTSSLGLDFGEALEMKLSQVSAELSLEQMVRFIEKFNSIIQEVKSSFIAQLPLELAIIELSGASESNIKTFVSSPIAPPTREKIVEKMAEKVTEKVVEVREIKTTTVVSEGSNLNITLEQIVAKWSDVVSGIKPLNHSVSFVLQACEITDLKGSKLCLTFKYRFHKDRINSVQIKPVLEKLLSEIYGASLSVEALLDENLVITTPEEVTDPVVTTETPMDNILKTFGGEIIN
jgi:DNA polymerase-3 subunit gamma/tau